MRAVAELVRGHVEEMLADPDLVEKLRPQLKALARTLAEELVEALKENPSDLPNLITKE